MGTAYPTILPYQTFHTKTADLALGVGSDKLWQTMCPLLGLGDLADDPRYVDNAARAANRESLIATLQQAFLTRSCEEWAEVLVQAGIPVGEVNTIDRVIEHPQVRARGVLVDVEHATSGPVRTVGPAVRLSDTPGTIRTGAPLLGEHTDHVLRERLRLSPETIADLRREGAIGAR
jgi:crotonobetainyl-CoA:carnitine CoA-transferase CaiB-like acyl-CoA transferase